MRCKNCDYRLWHLASRRCPECGTEFRPSDYEFTPNSVQFCCPHCEQAYYGTGPKGLLTPRSFDCVSCGRHIDLDEMVLKPAEGVDESKTNVLQVPWVERSERGFVRAWLSTVGMAMTSPGKLMRVLPMEAASAHAFGFCIVTLVAAMTVGILPIMLFQMAIMAGFGGPGGPAFVFPIVFGVGILVGPVIAIIVMAIWGLVTHGMLRLTGSTAGSMGRTMQAICYSSGAYVIAAIPCLGFYVAPIWWIVSAILMIREGQRVHRGRATLSVLTFPVLWLLALIGMQIFFFYTVTTWSPNRPTFVANATTDTEKVLEAMLKFSDDHHDQWPDHAIMLAAEDYIGAYDFVAGYTPTTMDEVPVCNITLEDFTNLPRLNQARFAKQAADNLPDNVVAHRLGDFVFTYHGIDPTNADPELWLVVLASDPDANSQMNIELVSIAGLSDGTTSMLSGALPSDPEKRKLELKSQNELRATYGLPPLPDPSTVTHTQPAMALPTSRAE